MEIGDGTPGRAFGKQIGGLPAILSGIKLCHGDLLDERVQMASVSSIAGVPSLEKTTGTWATRVGLHARPVALACGGLEKFKKNIKKIQKNKLWGFVQKYLVFAFPMS